MRSRADGAASYSFILGVSPFEPRWQGHLRHHGGAGAWFAADLKLAAQQRDPLPHAGEAYPLDRTTLARRRPRVEPSPLIPDLEAHLSSPARKRHARLGCPGVLSHVVERFL